MAVLFADVLQDFYEKKKTGALFISVEQSPRCLAGFYFEVGEIIRLCYGPLKGRECLELLSCYDLGNAVFLDNSLGPLQTAANDLPGTFSIISLVKSTGKTIQHVYFGGCMSQTTGTRST